jgi:hypothetical protein
MTSLNVKKFMEYLNRLQSYLMGNFYLWDTKMSLSFFVKESAVIVTKLIM